jgi:hypothetical protein
MSAARPRALHSMARELLKTLAPRFRIMPLVTSLFLVFQSLFWAVPALGDPAEPSSDPAPGDQARLAEALFDEAKQAMDEGDYASACSKFEESRRLDPAGGTQLALGVCYERAGQLASAWYAYREAFAAAQRDARGDREAIAEQRLSELEPRLSRVTVVVPSEVASLPTLRVELGALELRRPSWGLAVPFDAGSYVLRVSAQGYVPWTQEVVLGRAGDHQKVVIPVLAAAPATVPRANPPSNDVASERAAPNDSARSSINQKLGFVFAGAAAAAFIPGVYFGGRAIARGETVNDACNGNTCSRSAELDHQDAMSDARRANVLIAGGLVAAGVSVYFFLTAKPPGPPTKSRVGVGPSTLRLVF